jgi:hypothetical protein
VTETRPLRFNSSTREDFAALVSGVAFRTSLWGENDGEDSIGVLFYWVPRLFVNGEGRSKVDCRLLLDGCVCGRKGEKKKSMEEETKRSREE